MNYYGSIPSLKFTGCGAAGQFFANTLSVTATLESPSDDSPIKVKNFKLISAVPTTSV
jgi:hypothetical protein